MNSDFYISRKKYSSDSWSERKDYKGFNFKYNKTIFDEWFRPARHRTHGVGWLARTTSRDDLEWMIFFEGDTLLKELAYKQYLEKRKNRK